MTHPIWKLCGILTITLFLAAPARADIVIGLATPLTGHMAWAGVSNQVGAESAVADLNATGGVRGERVE